MNKKLIIPLFVLACTGTLAAVTKAEQPIPVSREMTMPQEEIDKKVLKESAKLSGKASKNATDAVSDEQQAPISLQVAVVVDDQMPPISAKDVDLILNTAQNTLRDKLGYNEINFVAVKTMSVEQFMNDSLAANPECLANLEPQRYTLDKEPDFEKYKEQMITFLKRWKIEELREFFPPEQAKKYQKHEDLFADVVAAYKQKIATIKDISLPSGAKLLDPAKAPYRSYVRWICAMAGQNAYDIVLTNEFVLYDLITEPFPHSIFQKCKVGGASLRSPKRHVIPERALFASTFGIENKLPFFDEDPENKYSHEEKQAITGMFILAHELGHAIFKLPDFYDHPDQCLMTTKAETDYTGGYQILKNNPGMCPSCQPWIKARRDYFHAIYLREHGKPLEAVEIFKNVIRDTPKHIDGSYRTFVADVGSNIAMCYKELANEKEMKRWLKSAHSMDPYSETPGNLWRLWFNEEIPAK